MKKLLLGLALASSLLFGAQGDHKAEITATIGGVKPEGNLDMENSLAYGLRFGTYLDEEMMFDLLEFGLERAGGVDYENSTSDTSINRFFVNLVKEYDLSKDTALYALAGVGFENIRNPLFENEDDGFFQYGVGVKHWINDNFALKAEVRHAITFESNNNLFYNLGFTIPLGKKEKDAPMAQEASPIKETPAVVEEPKKEEPKPVVVDNDTDKDGVLNADDHCPKTPAGKVVEPNGCMKVIYLNVNFDYDKSNVKENQMEKIIQVVEFMAVNPAYSVVLDGHTDSKGSLEYNMALAEKRANAVKSVLVAKGVPAEKITTNSFGETKPIATNKTAEGRAENRRVEAHFNK